MNLKKKSQLLKGTVELAVLSMLDREDLHGYKMMQELRKSKNDAIAVSEGNLYTILYRMESEGLLSGQWQTVTGKRRRKIYTITKFGKTEFSARKTFWKDLAQTLNRIFNTA